MPQRNRDPSRRRAVRRNRFLSCRDTIPAENPSSSSEIKTMQHAVTVIVGIAALIGTGDSSDAGCLNCRKSGNCDQCATSKLVLTRSWTVPASDCVCRQHVTIQPTPCCGITAGIGAVTPLGAGYGFHPARSEGFTGYKGLPNMVAGGVHPRYPYHSYRRPWAHPGPESTNVNIVW